MTTSMFIFTWLNLWWVSLLLVLPWGVKREETVELGHSPAAPADPMLKRKALAATLLSLVLTLILAAAIHYQLVPLKIDE